MAKRKAPAKLPKTPLLDEREEQYAAILEKLLPSPLTPADGVAFALLSAKVKEWGELSAMVKRDGITEYSDRSGVTHLSPAARREAEVFDEILKLCREFGMTPLSRAGLEAKAKSGGKETAKPKFAGFISADPGKPME